MEIITYCYINNDEPIVYNREFSEEDRRKMEALFPGSVIRWEEVRV